MVTATRPSVACEGRRPAGAARFGKGIVMIFSARLPRPPPSGAAQAFARLFAAEASRTTRDAGNTSENRLPAPTRLVMVSSAP